LDLVIIKNDKHRANRENKESNVPGNWVREGGGWVEGGCREGRGKVEGGWSEGGGREECYLVGQERSHRGGGVRRIGEN
jgi:hypothetical protein